MKTKIIALVAMSLLVALTIMNGVAFADTTTATVAFESGTLEFGDADMSNMDIDFGTRSLPVGPSTYEAVDGDHTLRVLDAREVAGGWTVTAELSAFVSTTSGVTNTFDATITLASPATDSNLTAVAPLTINSTESATDVVTAAADINNGTYNTTWTQENVKLSIGSAAATSINTAAAYEATMTWTLVLA